MKIKRGHLRLKRKLPKRKDPANGKEILSVLCQFYLYDVF